MRIGTMTVAADNPASPVPIPAPKAAIIDQNTSNASLPTHPLPEEIISLPF